MSPDSRFPFPEEIRLPVDARHAEAIERAVKNFRYIVGSVNDDALAAWADLWHELKDGVTPAGDVLPTLEQGFKPACGWPSFLEKFWLLKHYLDYIHRFCTTPPTGSQVL